MGRLLLLFIVVPAVELMLLIEIGKRIGTLETFALIVLTGIVGASLARRQGLRVVSEIQNELARGGMPADPLVDGLMILVASALLVTPGVLTDLVGFLCLAPAFRGVVKRAVVSRFMQAVKENRVEFRVYGETGSGGDDDLFGWPPGAEGRGDIVDVESERDEG